MIEDMIYLMNVRTLPKWLSSEPELFFVDLEQDPPKVVPFFIKSFLSLFHALILAFCLFVSRWWNKARKAT